MEEFSASRALVRTKYPYEIRRVLVPIVLLLIALSFGLLAIPLIWYWLSRKTTAAIRIDGDIFEVEYRQYLKRRTRRFNRTGIHLKLMSYEDSVSEPPYYVVLIYNNNKLEYEVDSRDGFSKEMLAGAIRIFATNLTRRLPGPPC